MARRQDAGIPCGYPLDMVLQKNMEDKLVCVRGQNLLRDPYQSACGCRYCKKCLDYMGRSKTIKCPVCVTEDPDDPNIILGQAISYPDRAVKKAIDSIKVKCLNEGCAWNGTCVEYDIHEDDCGFKRELCECGRLIPSRDLKQHRRTGCSNPNTVVCDLCKSHVAARDMEAHRQPCAQSEAQCELCDKTGIKRKDMAHHQRRDNPECRKKRERCPYTMCGRLIDLNDIQNHKTNFVAKHLDLVHQDVMALKLNDKSRNSQREMSPNPRRMETVADSTPPAAQPGAVAPPNPRRTHAANGSASGAGNGGGANLEDTCYVMQAEIARCLNKISSQDGELQSAKREIAAQGERLRAQERTLALKDATIAELSLKIDQLEMTRYDGVLLWKITDVARKTQDAVSGRTTSLYSPCFYTSRSGYKMCARIYLNGDGMGRGSHVSLFFLVMRGRYDSLLRWPFRQKVNMMILDRGQESHIVDAFRPDPTSSSFKRPTTDMNIASGCPLFAELSHVQNQQRKFIREDTMYVKVVVDCSDL